MTLANETPGLVGSGALQTLFVYGRSVQVWFTQIMDYQTHNLTALLQSQNLTHNLFKLVDLTAALMRGLFATVSVLPFYLKDLVVYTVLNTTNLGGDIYQLITRLTTGLLNVN